MKEAGFVVVILGMLLFMYAMAQLDAQSPPPSPCSAIVVRVTEDSVYAELQAPKGVRRCTVDVVERKP